VVFVRTILAILVVLPLIVPAAYAGSETETLITMLNQNGTVSDNPYGRLMAEQAQKQQVVAPLLEVTKLSDVEVEIEDGRLALKTRDGAFTTRLGGRLQLDAARYSGQPEMEDGTEVRRAYLTLQGTMYDDWGYRLQYNFASKGPNRTGILDTYIDYKGFDNVDLRVGHFKEPFTLQEASSDNFVTFTERALLAAFSPGRRIGAMASHGEKYSTWAVGLFGESIAKKERSVDEGWGASGRMTYALINEAGQLVHLGAGANYRDTAGANTVRFKQAPETHIAGVNIVDTGTIFEAKNVVKLSAEFATVTGPFSAQAEYISTSVNRSVGSDLGFDGWYLETAYFLTGESRQYKQGKFTKPLPKSNVGEGGMGAWQLALRYSTLDLSDGLIKGGEADAVTVGLNWFPTPTLRFTANYVDVLDVDGGPNDGLEPSVLQLRSQWAF
jgi:phosphate-selective porin OprO/OprP